MRENARACEPSLAIRRLIGNYFRAAAGVPLFITFAALTVSPSNGGELPDYFASTRTHSGPTEPPTTNAEITTESVRELVEFAERCLRIMATGAYFRAFDFAEIFDTTVDYYDEGQLTPEQIAAGKMAIFQNYLSYSSELVGNIILTDTDRPDVKWATFTYQYEITKRSGAGMRGLAEARWKLRSSGDQILVMATREKTIKK